MGVREKRLVLGRTLGAGGLDETVIADLAV